MDYSSITRAIDARVQGRTRERYAESSAGNRWITIGGKSDGDSSHRGGFPVMISSDGVILAGGPKGLRGKHLSKVGAYFERRKNTPTARRKRAESLSRRQAKKWNISTEEYDSYADEAWQVHQEHHQRLESARKRARQITGLNSGDIVRLENQYHDHGSQHDRLRQFDAAARTLAEEFPELGWGAGYESDGGYDSTDYSSKLWELLREGSQELPKPHSREYHAVVDEHIESVMSRQSEQDAAVAEDDYGEAGDELDFIESSGDDSFDPSEWDRFQLKASVREMLREGFRKAIERYSPSKEECQRERMVRDVGQELKRYRLRKLMVEASERYYRERYSETPSGHRWITINGAKVLIDESGKVVSGPKSLRSNTPRKGKVTRHSDLSKKREVNAVRMEPPQSPTSKEEARKIGMALRGSYQNTDTGWQIPIYADSIRHSLGRHGFPWEAMPLLPELIKQAVLFATEDDPSGEAMAYHHLYSPLMVGDQAYLAKLTVKECDDPSKNVTEHRLYALTGKKENRPITPAAAQSLASKDVNTVRDRPTKISIDQLKDMVKQFFPEHVAENL